MRRPTSHRLPDCVDCGESVPPDVVRGAETTGDGFHTLTHELAIRGDLCAGHDEPIGAEFSSSSVWAWTAAAHNTQLARGDAHVLCFFVHGGGRFAT